jgi:hypothetical protein
MKKITVQVALHGYGNIYQETFLALQNELGAFNPDIQWIVTCPSKDALLSRVRSFLITNALDKNIDVQIWLDHDIVWEVGELANLARRCIISKGVVGGLYPFRAQNSPGFPWRSFESKTISMGTDQLIEAEYIGGGFCAFHIPTIEQNLDLLILSQDANLHLSKCRISETEWFYDFCRPISIENGEFCDYLSDDWALNYRLRATGIKCFAWTRPLLTHIGDYGYTIKDALNVKQSTHDH